MCIYTDLGHHGHWSSYTMWAVAMFAVAIILMGIAILGGKLDSIVNIYNIQSQL